MQQDSPQRTFLKPTFGLCTQYYNDSTASFIVLSTIERKASSHRPFFEVLSYLNPSALPVCTPQRCTRTHTRIRGLHFTTRHLELCQNPITFAPGAPFLSSSTQSPQSFHGSPRSIRSTKNIISTTQYRPPHKIKNGFSGLPSAHGAWPADVERRPHPF